MEMYNQQNRQQRNGGDRGDKKQRFKGIRKNDNAMSAQECNDRFDYAKHASELLDKDDINCSKEVIRDMCNSFEDMGGEVGLKEELLRGIIAYGFEEPSRIQSYVIPQIIAKREIIAQSQSGTGKTGSFVISALQLIDENANYPQAIIISPTCELAHQTCIVGKAIGTFMENVNFSFTVGGSDRNNNIRELGGLTMGKKEDKVSQIVIATPGRLMDIFLEHPQLFENIKLLIIDECDELLSGAFKDELRKIIQSLPQEIQICLFSATLTDEVVKLSKHILKDPIQILIKKEKMTLDGIKQTFISVNSDQDKRDILIEMLSTLQIQQFIVYVNSKKSSDILKEFLEKENFAVMTINSSNNKYERAEIIRTFKQGGAKCLISTDLLSRGIDIQQLSLVINYDLPRSDNIQSYIHRIGRSGRYGKKGLAINLVTKYELVTQNLISLTFKCPIVPLEQDFVKYL
jgi:superfamily II DNA/RNA helicase